MAQHILQEEDVGLHTSDLELVQGALHLLDCMHIAVGPHNHLHEAWSQSVCTACNMLDMCSGGLHALCMYCNVLPKSSSHTLEVHNT